ARKFIGDGKFQEWFRTEFRYKTLIIAAKEAPRQLFEKIKPLITVYFPEASLAEKSIELFANQINIHPELVGLAGPDTKLDYQAGLILFWQKQLYAAPDLLEKHLNYQALNSNYPFIISGKTKFTGNPGKLS